MDSNLVNLPLEIPKALVISRRRLSIRDHSSGYHVSHLQPHHSFIRNVYPSDLLTLEGLLVLELSEFKSVVLLA